MIHKTLYCRSSHITAPIIRFFDGMGPWSHCAGILADGEHVVEARAFHGVKVVPLSEVIARCTEFEIVEREVEDKKLGDSWALSTVGAEYDWLGAFGVPWRRNYEDREKWFCSEHAEHWMRLMGLERFKPEKRGIGPNLSYYVN